MKNLLFLATIGLLLNSCSKSPKLSETLPPDKSIQLSKSTAVLSSTDPKAYYGVVLGTAQDLYAPISGGSSATRPVWVSGYGVKYYRLTITHDEWVDTTTLRPLFLTNYEAAVGAGLQVLLNVNWNKHDSGPTDFPDAVTYVNFLSNVLTTIYNRHINNALPYKPALVVVENEETSPGYYNINSTTKDMYIKQLSRAAEFCALFTNFGNSRITVTNGGIHLRMFTYIAWQYEVDQNKIGTSGKDFKDSYLYYAVPRSQFYAYNNTVTTPPDVTVVAGKKADMQAKMALGVALVKAYDTIQKLSYVNLHWYEPCSVAGWVDNVDSKNGNAFYQGNILADPTISMNQIVMDSALTSVKSIFKLSVDDLRAGYVKNKPFCTNETGQLTSYRCLTNSILQMYKPYFGTTDYPFICWYDGDGHDALGNYDYFGKALHDDNAGDGTRDLRPTGVTFKNYLANGLSDPNCN